MITKLLKKEIKDEEKTKMTNKLTTLKKQCVIHKEALEKEREIVKGEKVELEKKYKSWRNYCLESEKKSKGKEKELNVALAKEKSE